MSQLNWYFDDGTTQISGDNVTSGDPFFTNAVFRGDTGDIKIGKAIIRNDSSNLKYDNITVTGKDTDTNAPLDLELESGEGYSVDNIEDEEDNVLQTGTFSTDSEEGQNTVQFYQSSSISYNFDDYDSSINLSTMTPGDELTVFILMLVPPNTSTDVYSDLNINVTAVESTV